MMRLPLLPLLHVLPAKPTFKLPRPPTICKYSSTTTSLPIPPPPSSAYVHLPFCRKRCHYCDFPIVALGISSPYHPDSDLRISDYIHLLLREIKSTKLGPGPRRPLETVFFGGGTPSLVPPRLISAVLETLFAEFGAADNPEVSIEMDPGTFDAQKLDELVGLGITRVSLGVQAFQQELLKACGRAHGLEEVEAAIEMVGACRGLENWSIDLISSLPLQTEAMWDESLRRSLAAAPTHVSVYDLQIEKGTKFGQL